MKIKAKKGESEATREHGDMGKHFRPEHWLAAVDIDRPFVRHTRSEPSPAFYRKYSCDESPIELSVVIPTLDAYRGGYFEKLLDQIKRQAFSGFEVIIVRGDHLQGRAINIGAAVAQGRYLMTLDDDTCLPDPDTFQKLVTVMEKHPEIGMAGGNNVIPENATSLVRRVMTQIPRRSWPPVRVITDSDLAEHPLLIMKKEVFTAVGGENEHLPRGLDPYLRQEFRRAGYRVVVVPDVIYSHLPPATMNRLIKQFFRNGQKAAFCNKYYPQWVIETPENHVKNFAAQRPFIYRVARHLVNLLKRAQKKHWIYIVVTLVYAMGFIWGYLVYKDEGTP